MWKVAEEKNIIFLWILWHFVRGPREIYERFRNIFVFSLNYFSIPFLFKTFFAPWRRYRFSYGRGFDVGRFFEVFVFNTFSRAMGAIIRLFVILLGVVTQIVIFVMGAISLVVWIILPVVTIVGVIIGLQWII